MSLTAKSLGYAVNRIKQQRVCRSKEPFSSQREANIVADAIDANVKLFCYRCPMCSKWHLTKKHKTKAERGEAEGEQ